MTQLSLIATEGEGEILQPHQADVAFLEEELAILDGLHRNLGQLRSDYLKQEGLLLTRLAEASSLRDQIIQALSRKLGIDKKPGEWAFDRERKAFVQLKRQQENHGT